MNEPRTYNLTGIWSWCVFMPSDGGRHGFIQVHWGKSPRAGDYLICPNGERTTRYRVVEIKTPLAADVDFWSADVEFDPR
jgi:hypothetical protein